jgi:APA family basic amino acid/polyamine antiporter
VICIVLYVLVCVVITGLQKYPAIEPKAALAEAFRQVAKPGFATSSPRARPPAAARIG